eukprot:GHVH01004639.1.p1 GENE.GHVH01004639.1~~GHVH01004639.1.p1  ORF type:complete len:413 (-),score=67.06 GHVH01004639.1:954-2192(-)
MIQIPRTNAAFIAKEEERGCFNYKPIGVVIEKAKGAIMTDVEGNDYLDCMAAYSAVNQGHCHPRLVAKMMEQCQKLTLTSRAFHNDQLPVFCHYITDYFGYDRVLPMNSGVEAGESAVKIMRRWAYEKKGVKNDKAVIIFPKDNFWGRSIAACSSSTDPECRVNYGPFMPGFVHVPFGDVDALAKCIEENRGNVAGFYVEPIQGEAGVKVPPLHYLKKCKELLQKENALLCCDEIQSGLFRTGKLLASDWDEVRPDLVVLGKALSGGMLPVSCVLGSDAVMSVLTPGTHGSTYGGNPLAMAISIEALQILKDERLGENSLVQGERFRAAMNNIKSKVNYIVDVRGRGLFNAVEISPNHRVSATDICYRLKDEGILAKPTHDTTIRFTPPLCVTDAQIDKLVAACDKVFAECK